MQHHHEDSFLAMRELESDKLDQVMMIGPSWSSPKGHLFLLKGCPPLSDIFLNAMGPN